MILLKAAILFVLANPAEFYPYTPASVERTVCYPCSEYLRQDGVVPEYPKLPINDDANSRKLCGKANPERLSVGLPVTKKDNTTETMNSKIMGGSDAAQNEFPWQVGLALGYGSEIICGGSIISSKEILTAAHCVQNERYNYPLQDGEVFPIKECIYAVVGEHDTSDINEGEQWNRICNVQVHQQYIGAVKEFKQGHWVDQDYWKHDIAILTLCTELQFTDKVAPVCLPQKNIRGKYYKYENKAVTVSGWGLLGNDEPSPEKLQKVKLQTLSNTDCFDPTKYKWPSSDKDESLICAYGFDNDGEFNGKDSSEGDSGGPMVISGIDADLKIFYTVIGVVSYSYGGNAQEGYPGVYARVTKAMKWITQKVNPDGTIGIKGTIGTERAFYVPQPPAGPAPAGAGSFLPSICKKDSKLMELRKNTKNSRSSKNTEGVTYYRFEKDKKLSRKKAQETCISKYGGQLTSINTQDEYEWIKEQVIDLKMFGQIAIGGQWKDKSSRKFEWTDKSEMDMSVLNANWFRTRWYRFPSYKNKKRINLELWYSRRALGFANALDHKAPTMYICKVAESCTSCSSCSE